MQPTASLAADTQVEFSHRIQFLEFIPGIGHREAPIDCRPGSAPFRFPNLFDDYLANFPGRGAAAPGALQG
jgi:hypothetical protein